MDGLLCDYLEELWANGEGRALASDTLAALQDASPKLRGCIPGAWRLLKAWHVNEIPNRAPPFPERVLLSLVGYFVFHGDPSMALSVLLGFYSVLRTGEILGIRNKDVTIDAAGNTAVISLGYTKGGKRLGAAESTTVTVKEVLKERIRELESSQGRSQMSGDYLKHVVLKYIEYCQKGDMKSQSLVPVLCTLLNLNSTERKLVEHSSIPAPLQHLNQAAGAAGAWFRGSAAEGE
eukprot:s294_g12.t1